MGTTSLGRAPGRATRKGRTERRERRIPGSSGGANGPLYGTERGGGTDAFPRAWPASGPPGPVAFRTDNAIQGNRRHGETLHTGTIVPTQSGTGQDSQSIALLTVGKLVGMLTGAHPPRATLRQTTVVPSEPCSPLNGGKVAMDSLQGSSMREHRRRLVADLIGQHWVRFLAVHDLDAWDHLSSVPEIAAARTRAEFGRPSNGELRETFESMLAAKGRRGPETVAQMRT